MTPMFFVVLQISVLACGAVSGVFLAFSDFVMKSLNGAQTSAGVEVMQVINRKVWRSVFMVLLLGMSALSPFLMGYAYFQLAGPAAAWVITGGAIYLAGVFAVSLIFNVPMNHQLAARQFAGAEAAAYWEHTYMPRWTGWNYVRAVSSVASAACYLVASTWVLWVQAVLPAG